MPGPLIFQALLAGLPLERKEMLDEKSGASVPEQRNPESGKDRIRE